VPRVDVSLRRAGAAMSCVTLPPTPGGTPVPTSGPHSTHPRRAALRQHRQGRGGGIPAQWALAARPPGPILNEVGWQRSPLLEMGLVGSRVEEHIEEEVEVGVLRRGRGPELCPSGASPWRQPAKKLVERREKWRGKMTALWRAPEGLLPTGAAPCAAPELLRMLLGTPAAAEPPGPAAQPAPHRPGPGGRGQLVEGAAKEQTLPGQGTAGTAQVGVCFHELSFTLRPLPVA